MDFQPKDAGDCADRVACSLPFSIHELDKKTLQSKSVYSYSKTVFGLPTVAVPIDENIYIFSGSMQVREINKKLGWKLEEAVAKTINGYILESLDNIPSKGVIFKKNGYIFEVIEVSNNFVNNVKVTKK